MSGPPPPVVIPNFGGASKCVTNNDLFCTDWVQHNWGSTLQPALLDHVKLTVIAVAIGFVIAFAAAVVARRLRFVEHPFTLFGALLYTIPSIALFQLLVPFTGLTETTVEIALIGYTLLILFRNTLTGLREVPPEVRDAAKGMGMGATQLLLRDLTARSGAMLVSGVTPIGGLTISLGAGDVVRSLVLRSCSLILAS